MISVDQINHGSPMEGDSEMQHQIVLLLSTIVIAVIVMDNISEIQKMSNYLQHLSWYSCMRLCSIDSRLVVNTNRLHRPTMTIFTETPRLKSGDLHLRHAACTDNLIINISIPVNTKHLYNICTTLAQRRRRWADVVQMLYKCFVFAEI